MSCSKLYSFMASGSEPRSNCVKPAANDAVFQSDSEIGSLDEKVAIWNPYLAAFCSLLLTPAFGSFLLLKNWQAMGDMEKYKPARYWFYGSLTVLALNLIMPLMPGNPVVGQFIADSVALAYLGAWYLIAATDQASYLREKFGKECQRRPWGQALLIGLIGLAGYYALALFIGFLMGA